MREQGRFAIVEIAHNWHLQIVSFDPQTLAIRSCSQNPSRQDEHNQILACAHVILALRAVPTLKSPCVVRC